MDQSTEIAKYYDDIYFKEDVYKKEAERISQIIETYKKSEGNKLLDVACGTGTHFKFFTQKYDVSGLDYSQQMLKIAKKKYPNIRLFHYSMDKFNLNTRFDVIVCLYGSIAFVKTVQRLNRTISNFADHLNPNGLLLIVPWSCREKFRDKIVTDRVKKNGTKIVRMENVQKRGSDKVAIESHYLIGKNRKIQYIRSKSVIGLFSRANYLNAISKAGLKLIDQYEDDDIQMNEIFICKKP
jgi:SAM-dependent methyltransferase